MSALSKVAKALAKAAEKGMDTSPTARKARAVEQGYMTPRKMKELTDNPKIDIVPTNNPNDVEANLLINNYELAGGTEDFLRNYPKEILEMHSPFGRQANGLSRSAYMRLFPSKITHPEFDMDAPMTFYHGTAGDLSSLNPNYLGRTTGAASANHGTFLSNLPEDANEYAVMASSRNPKEQRSLDIISRLNDEIRNAEKHKDLFVRYNMIDNGGDPKFLEKQEAYIERLLNRMRMIERGLGRDNYSTIYPVHIRPENPMFVDKQGGSYGDITKNLAKAKDLGHDSVIFFDIKDPNPGATHAVMFEPEKIRSINAMFDPERINSRDLLASMGGLGALGLTDEVLDEQEPEEYASGGLVKAAGKVAKKGAAALEELLENMRKADPERLKRAEEAGFDTNKVWLHGTNTDELVNEGVFLKPENWFTDNPDVASIYAQRNPYDLEISSNLLPVFIRDIENKYKFYPEADHAYTNLEVLRKNRNDIRSIFNDFTPESLADEKFAHGGLVQIQYPYE